MQEQRYVRWQYDVVKVCRRCCALHIAEEIEIDWFALGLAERADSSSQFAEAGMSVAWLDTFQGRAQLCDVSDGLGQYFELAAESHDLRSLRRRFSGQSCEGLLLSLYEASLTSPCSCAHAEGFIQHNQQQPSIGVFRAPADKGIGKRQNHQQHQRKPQCE